MYPQPVTFPGVGAVRVSQGNCQDCNAAADVFSAEGDTVVVHAGKSCQAFRDRFTPSDAHPVVSRAWDEKGWRSPDPEKPAVKTTTRRKALADD